MKILKSIEKLAVDSNAILSAIIGGSSRVIFLKSEGTAFYTTFFNFKEVEKYIPRLSSRKNIPIEDLLLALSMLPVIVCDEEFYKTKIGKAKLLLRERDPDDRHLLALAFELGCPIWSNDRDFEGLGIRVYGTPDLLKGA